MTEEIQNTPHKENVLQVNNLNVNSLLKAVQWVYIYKYNDAKAYSVIVLNLLSLISMVPPLTRSTLLHHPPIKIKMKTTNKCASHV